MAVNWDSLVNAPALAVYGEAVTYTPAGGPSTSPGPFPLSGVFDEAYRQIDVYSESPVSSTVPQLGVQLVTFPAGVTPLQGDRILIRGASYTVREVQPDSHGWARLLLNEASS